MLSKKSVAVIEKLLAQKKDVKISRGPGGAPVIYVLEQRKQYSQVPLQKSELITNKEEQK